MSSRFRLDNRLAFDRSQCRDTIDWQNGDKIYVEKPSGGKFGGFANVHAFVHAVDDFLTAHAWAFYTNTRALVASKGGIEWLEAAPPKVINIRLRPRFATPATQWDRNPSTPLKFESSSDITSAEYNSVVSNTHSWDSETMTIARTNSFRKLQARYGHEFAGLVSLFVTVDGVGAFARFDFFPLRRPRGLPPDQKLEGKEIQKQILDDARVLCKQSVNSGLPLGASGTDRWCVYPGKFVLEQKRWEWRPLFEDWAMYEAYRRNAVIDAALNKFRSGLFVVNVIANVQRL